MRLLLTGTTPLLWIALLGIVSVALGVWFYRQQPLKGSWRWLLPAIRTLVLMLLCICLLQPVLSRKEEQIKRGVVAVIIDNSESMGVLDPYLEWQKLKLAAHLDLMEVDLKDAQFERRAQSWNTVVENSYKSSSWFAAIIDEKATEGMHQRLKPFENWMTQFEKIFVEEENALKPNLWERFEKEGSAFQKILQSQKNELIQGRQKIDEQYKKLEQHIQRLKQKEPDTLAQFSNSFKQLVELIQRQSRNWIETQIKVGIEQSKGVNVDLKSFNDIMNSPDRLALIKNCLVSTTVRKLLEEKGELRFFDLNENKGEIPPQTLDQIVVHPKRTSLGSKVREVLKQYDDHPVAAILILSDGNNNAGLDLDSAKQMATDREIPIYGAGVGGAYAPPDVAVEKVIVPKSSFKGDLIRVQAIIGREGMDHQKIKVKLISAGNILQEKIIEPGQSPKELVQFSFHENRAGRQRYRVVTEEPEGDVLTQNNEKEIEVNILGDRIKTLFIEEFPRWESRYAVMMLERDPRIELNAVFIASSDSGRLPKGERGFPSDSHGLHAYHILILGDVNPRHFSREQMEDIKSFVLSGGTLMVISGSQHMPHKYLQTPLVDVLPLHLSTSSSEADSNAFQDVKLKVTLGSQFEDIVSIGSDVRESVQLWEGLPSMNWVNRQVEAAPVANNLVDSVDGRPLVSRADIGAGKVLYLGSDSFWRWRNRARWTYHHRFWSQILLWATSTRTTGKDAQVKLMSSKGIYDPDQKIELKAKLLDGEGLPKLHSSASVEIRNEKGELVRKAPLVYIVDSAGDYKISIPPLGEGKYRVRPVIADISRDLSEAEINFEVKQLPTSERLALQLDHQKMSRLCDQVEPLDAFLNLIDNIQPVEETVQNQVDIEIWDSFPFMILISLLLGLEWHVRKKIGLV